MFFQFTSMKKGAITLMMSGVNFALGPRFLFPPSTSPCNLSFLFERPIVGTETCIKRAACFWVSPEATKVRASSFLRRETFGGIVQSKLGQLAQILALKRENKWNYLFQYANPRMDLWFVKRRGSCVLYERFGSEKCTFCQAKVMGLYLILGKRRLKLWLWATNNKITMCVLELMMYWLRKMREG